MRLMPVEKAAVFARANMATLRQLAGELGVSYETIREVLGSLE